MRALLGVPALFVTACVLGRVPPEDSPPAPRKEPVPARPPECREPRRPCHFWPGYWHYDGGRYRWMPGRWEPIAPLDLVAE